LQSEALLHDVRWQTPGVAPLQLQAASPQVAELVHERSWQVPGATPVHVDPYPQSLFTSQLPLPPTWAEVATWKSENTARPHWFAGCAVSGALNVNAGSKAPMPPHVLLPPGQSVFEAQVHVPEVPPEQVPDPEVQAPFDAQVGDEQDPAT
jgi:hypothetical protein